ncbi:DUF6765 family protein [Desulfobaculum sp.]
MQLDMHYYGTYALAYAAGLNEETARKIATSAQFVDDNAEERPCDFDDGAMLQLRATAHHCEQIENINADDQRQVWVPFHFLPGAEGATYEERLMCRMNSPVVQELVAHHLGLRAGRFSSALIGVLAHVFADTYSHYGFCGVSCAANEVEQDSIDFHGGGSGKECTMESFCEKYTTRCGAFFAEQLSGALGHGGVATYPDQPYLRWEFDYEHRGNGPKERDNQKTFLEACRALHGIFVRYGHEHPELASGAVHPFDDIEDAVKEVLRLADEKEARCDAWTTQAADGSLLGGDRFVIPAYDPEPWNEGIKLMDDTRDSSQVLDLDVFHFYQAAALHRSYVLRQLLPKYDLVVA